MAAVMWLRMRECLAQSKSGDFLSQRQGEQEHRSVIEFALGADSSAVGQNDMLGNCQTQTGAARLPGPGLVHAVETLEQPRQVLGRNARPEILDIEFDAFGDG